MAKSELVVLTKSKELVEYIFTITKNSPKLFRFTFVNRMQNLCLDLVSELFIANRIYIKVGDDVALGKRRFHQNEALTKVYLLGYVSYLAMRQECITKKQYEYISTLIKELVDMIGFWAKSDQVRMKKNG